MRKVLGIFTFFSCFLSFAYAESYEYDNAHCSEVVAFHLPNILGQQFSLVETSACGIVLGTGLNAKYPANWEIRNFTGYVNDTKHKLCFLTRIGKEAYSSKVRGLLPSMDSSIASSATVFAITQVPCDKLGQ